MAKLWSALFASKRRNRRTTYLSIAASPWEFGSSSRIGLGFNGSPKESGLI
jgi:hypothetical protein